MKRIISVLCIIVMLFSLCVATVNASPKDDILAKVEASVPASFIKLHRNQTINILTQLEITEDQAQKLIALIDEVAPKLEADKTSISDYPQAMRDYFIDAFERGCAILNLKYTIVHKTKTTNVDTHYAVLYDASGRKIGTLEGDLVNDTGAAETNVSGLIALLVVLGLSAAAVTGYAVKKSAVHA